MIVAAWAPSRLGASGHLRTADAGHLLTSLSQSGLGLVKKQLSEASAQIGNGLRAPESVAGPSGSWIQP